MHFQTFLTRCFAVLAFILLGSVSIAQTSTSDPIPRCGLGPFDLCGYVDPATGEFLTQPIFQRAGHFYSERALVQQNGLYGYLQPDLTFAIAPQYLQANPFRHGWAEVSDGTGARLISLDGVVLAIRNFFRIVPISENRAIATTREHLGPFDDHSSVRREADLSYTTPASIQSWGFVDIQTGRFDIVVESQFRRSETSLRRFEISASPVAVGYWQEVLIAQSENLRLTQFGLMGGEGEWILPPVFNSVRLLQGGLTIVSIRTPGHGRWAEGETFVGLVGPDGSFQIEPTVGLDLEAGGGSWLFPHRPANASFFARAGVSIPLWDDILDPSRHRYGFIAPDGSVLGDRQYRGVKVTRYGIRTAREEGTTVFVDDEGATVPASRANDLLSTSHETSGGTNWIRMPRIDDYWTDTPSLACANGVERFGYSEAGVYFFSDREWLFGLRTTDGEILVPAEYGYISCPRDGVAWVSDEINREFCPVVQGGQAAPNQPCIQSGNFFRNFIGVGDMCRISDYSDGDWKSGMWWHQRLLSLGNPDEFSHPGNCGVF